MLKVIDIVYYTHQDLRNPMDVISKHHPANGFAHFMDNRIHLQFVKHLDYEGIRLISGTRYAFFKSVNRFWHIPFKTHRYIKSQNPDVVIVEGLIFPLQLMMLKWSLGKYCRIVAQHHGESPFSGMKAVLQKSADRFIDAYIFTASKNAGEWIDRKIIKDASKCREVLESSTSFVRRNRKLSQEKINIMGIYNYLWVGRLNQNKDPLAVLKGFEKYARYQRDACLYMIYQEDDLLPEIEHMRDTSPVLKRSVKLIGKIGHLRLNDWFSACNFYISGSHREGSGYALLEAMACGCIPIVTTIPSFEKITMKGNHGFLYPPGNYEMLALVLESMHHINIDLKRKEIELFFHENLSFRNIAENLCQVISQL
jgi:glycosyltransferase involved in cell wall biosynthesis